MGYVVKHSTSNVNKTRRKGNVALGVSAGGYNKTSVSGLYAGVPPVEGKHNFVRVSEGGTPNFYSLTDEELINFVNGLGERNLTTTTPSQGGWAGSYSLLDNNNRNFRFNVSNFNGDAGSGQGWRSFTWDLRAYTGQSVTISATVEVPAASPGTFAWIRMGQTNTHTNNGSGAGTFMGYSAASEYIHKSTSTTERITWSGTLGNSGTASQPSGHVGFTVWYNGGTSGVNSYIDVSNVQIEIEDHATEFSSPNLSVFYTLEAKNYLNSRSDIMLTDALPDALVTDGLVLALDAKNQSSFLDNQPTTNLITANGLDFTQMSTYGDLNRVQVPDVNSPSGYACEMEVLDGENINPAARCMFGDNTDMPSSGNAMVSIYAKFEGGPSSNIAPYIYNGSGTSWQQLLPLDGGSNYLTSEYRRFGIYQAITYNPGFSMVKGNSNIQTGQKVRWHSPQVELQTLATGFVSGSRSQNTTWYDLSGNGNAVAVNSPVFADNSFTFDETNEYFSLTNNELTNISGSVTLMGVCKQGNTGTPHQTILCTDINYRNGLKLLSRYHGAAATWIGNSDGTDSYVLSSGVDITNDGKWHHLATTRDMSTGELKIYVDGIFKNSVTTYTGSTSIQGIAAVGVDYHSSGYYYVGNISSVKAYDQVLSQSEIFQNYYGGPIVTDGLIFAIDASNLVSYESGNTIYDLTGNYTGMSLYGNTDYGNIDNTVIHLSASGNADSNGCILRSDETISTTLNSDFTTTGWLYRTSTNSAELMSYRETWQRLSLEIIDTGIYFNQRETVDANSNGSYNTFQTSVSVTNSRNVWEHFALSKSGTQWSFYKNGEHIGTNTFSMTETVSGAGFHIGAAWSDDDYLGRAMNGKVGPVQHYTSSLSSSEVLQNYNAQRNRFL